jgi:hypothetical protein
MQATRDLSHYVRDMGRDSRISISWSRTSVVQGCMSKIETVFQRFRISADELRHGLGLQSGQISGDRTRPPPHTLIEISAGHQKR